MELWMWSCTHSSQESIVPTTNIFSTRGRWDFIFVFVCSFWSRECCSPKRNKRGPKTSVLHEKSIAKAWNTLPYYWEGRLVWEARRLRRNFLANTIIVRIDQWIRKILFRWDMISQMTKWFLKLFELYIKFEAKKALTVHMLIDFLEGMNPSLEYKTDKLIILVDVSYNSKGNGAGIILENEERLIVEVSLGLSFTMTNNQA